jgi:hypothetical protein
MCSLPTFRGPLWAVGLALVVAATPPGASPIVPASDDEVIEILPSTSSSRSEERRLRQALAARPDDPALALKVAQRYLDQAHALGDPRFAGLALAALRAWPDASRMPPELLLMKATLQQYLHEFDDSVASLRLLLARPASERPAQAWLTLATVLRVQGRYADSDAACREVGGDASAVYRAACLAENAALRGDVAGARRSFEALLADRRLAEPTRAWITTSLAELEEREGRVAAADSAYRAVLRLGPDPYAAIAYADFLLAQRRPAEAAAVLQGLTRSDAVVLRLAMAEALSAVGPATPSASAGRGAGAAGPGARPAAAEMRERIALANERPTARVFHGREQALFALFVERAPERALELARGNVARQREPLDLLVLAQAARASSRPEAVDEARRLKALLGLHDRRLDALL